MWHASAASSVGAPTDKIKIAALLALEGVGDATAGEWAEISNRAVHIRRRLTEREAVAVGEVRDVRGTGEARRRVNAIRPYLARVGWDGVIV